MKILKIKYEAQALAIVLIVLVVAVIIGMAIISRVFNDRVLVDDERSSAEALEIADTALDSVKDIKFEDLIAVAESPAMVDICATGFTGYEFLRDGCVLENLDELEKFLIQLSVINPNFDASPYLSSISSDLSTQCNNENEGISMTFAKFDAAGLVDIQQDDTFAIVTSSKAPTASPCYAHVDVTSQGSSPTGVITTAIYATIDGAGDITGYKEYETSDIIGYCLGNASCTNSDYNNWVQTDGSINGIPVNKGGMNLYELRIRAIDNPVSVSTSFTNNATGGGNTCLKREDLIKVSSTVNCNGNSRGKEFIITGEDWAPSIFDYVLFNGDGQLRNL